jgi:NLI interacting factor-like phosphatase
MQDSHEIAKLFTSERPHLHYFLEKVAEMFEIVIFTASYREYASEILDKLDPEGRIFSRRFYQDSCTFKKRGCVKDLTILGVDLAKVAIIDNSPKVYVCSICLHLILHPRFCEGIRVLFFMSVQLSYTYMCSCLQFFLVSVWCHGRAVSPITLIKSRKRAFQFSS